MVQQQNVLLLDLSLRCAGYAVVPYPFPIGVDGNLLPPFIPDKGGVPAYGEFKIENTKVSTQERVGMLSLLVGSLIDAYSPLFVAAEVPANAFQGHNGVSVSNASSTKLQQQAFGAIMALCWSRGMPYIEVEPAWSKQCLTGNRSANKQKVAESLARKAGVKKIGPRYKWPQGMTKESVRDALAVLFFLHFRSNIFGEDWIDRVLSEQMKPDLGDHKDSRGFPYAALQLELSQRHTVKKTTTRSVKK
jgi:Holliday junction resolvasome RuvABC endonuclease subunit